MDRIEVADKLSYYDDLAFLREPSRFRLDESHVFYAAHQLNEEGIANSAKWVGVPPAFLEKCSTQLQVENLNEFFDEALSEGAKPVAIIKEDKLISMVDQRDRTIQCSQLLDIIEGNFEIREYDRVSRKNGIVELYVSTMKEEAVAVDDLCAGGFMIEFSPFGEIIPSIFPYVTRLSCTNGVTTTKNIGRFSNKSQDPLEDWVTTTAKEALERLATTVDGFRRMKEIPVNGNATTIVSQLLSGVSRQVKEELYEHIDHEQVKNMYELLNAVTFFGSHLAEDPKHAFRMMSFGGDLAEHFGVCPTCHAVMKGAVNQG